jgi:hypothetical protein
LADLVDHLYGQGAPPVQDFRSARTRTEQIGEFGLGMSELFDRIVQQIYGIGDIDDRPAALFVFLDKRCENIELVTVFGAGRSAPKPFDFAERRAA